MRMPSRKYLLGAAAVAALGAGVAEAATAKLHEMSVDGPGGAVVHVQYSGDVAPSVEIVPAGKAAAAGRSIAADPFVQMEQIFAEMDARANAMMQQAFALQQQQAQMMMQHAVVTGGNAAPGMVITGNAPKGMHVSYYSSTTGADGCTRTVSWSSDGSGDAPKVIQAASDACGSATAAPAMVQAKAEKPAAAVSTPAV